MKKVSIALVTVLLASCALVPSEKKRTDSVNAAEKITAQNAVQIKRVVEGEKTPPTPNVAVSGSSNRVEISVNPSRPIQQQSTEGESPSYTETTTFTSSTGQDSTTKAASKNEFSVTIPFGVKMALLAVGLALLCGVIWFAVKVLKRNSAAAAAAFEMADQTIATGLRQVHNAFGASIQRHREKAMTTTDPATIASQQVDIAALESERGKLSSILEAERGKLAGKQP